MAFFVSELVIESLALSKLNLKPLLSKFNTLNFYPSMSQQDRIS
ncbi:hypothetical protein VCR3J2_300074 [Vibrio coralliirubri]|nr:hypothetical protein VCR3J2_300074 [Vibrio coralliirubri]